MSIVLDLIVLAIIVITVLISAKRGFVRTLIELVGFIAAVFISFTISTPLANTTYDKIIEPSIISSVSSVADTAAGNSVATVDSFWNEMPEWIKNGIERAGISKDSLGRSITANIGNGIQSEAESASQSVIKPAVTTTLSLIYQTIILIVLLALVKPLAKLINKLFSFSVIGTANRVLGGVVGVPKGIIYAIVFCLLITLIVSFTSNGFLIFTGEAIKKSLFFSFVNSLRLI